MTSPRRALFAAALTTLSGCADSIHQVMGVGAIYSVRCSAEMEASEVEYRARCAPPPCADDYVELGLSHVVVAVDPGRKVLGYAERTCGQDIQSVARGGLLAVDGAPIE